MIEAKIDQVYPQSKKALSSELKEESNLKFLLPESITLTYKDIDIIDDQNIPRHLKSTPYIHLSHNRLTSLKGISSFRHLQGLSVSHNKIKDWKELLQIHKPERIQFLRVRRNPLCNHPNYHSKILTSFPNLQSLDEVKIDEKCIQVKYQTQHASQPFLIQFLKMMQHEFQKISSKMCLLYYPQIEPLGQELQSSSNTVDDIDFEFFDLLMAFLNHDPTLKLKKSASSVLLGGFFLRLWKMLGNTLLNVQTGQDSLEEGNRPQMQTDFLHRILSKYRERHDHRIEQFLQSQCDQNEKIDLQKLQSDLSYGYACFLDELYKVSEPPNVEEYLFVKKHLKIVFDDVDQNQKQEALKQKSFSQQQKRLTEQSPQMNQGPNTFRSEIGLSGEHAEDFAKEQKKQKSYENQNKNTSELSAKNVSYYLYKQEQADTAAKQKALIEKEQRMKGRQSAEVLMLKNYFPLFLLNQEYMEIVFEIVLEKMISLLHAYESLLYGEIEDIQVVASRFAASQRVFNLFDPDEEIFLSIQNIRARQNKPASQNNHTSTSYQNSMKNNYPKTSNSSRKLLSKNGGGDGISVNNKSKAELSIQNLKKQQQEHSQDGNREQSMQQQQQEEDKKQESVVDKLNDTLARINSKRGISHRASFTQLPSKPTQVSFLELQKQQQNPQLQNQQKDLSSRQKDHTMNDNSTLNFINNYPSRLSNQGSQRSIDKGRVRQQNSEQFISDQQKQFSQRQNDNSISPFQRQYSTIHANDDDRQLLDPQDINKRSQSGFSNRRVSIPLSHQASESRFKNVQFTEEENNIVQQSLSNDKQTLSNARLQTIQNTSVSSQLNNAQEMNPQTPFRDQLLIQQGVWESQTGGQKSLQKAQYFCTILKVVLWRRVEQMLIESMNRIKIKSDKRLQLLEKVLCSRQKRDSLRKWQRRTLKITKNNLFALLRLQKFFNLLKEHTKLAIKQAKIQYETQTKLKVFYGFVKIIKNKKRVKKGLRKIAKVVRQKVLNPVFQQIVFLCLRIPKDSSIQQLSFDRFFEKSKRILCQPSILTKIEEQSKAFLILSENNRINLKQQYQDQQQLQQLQHENSNLNTIEIKDSFRVAAQQMNSIYSASRLQPNSHNNSTTLSNRNQALPQSARNNSGSPSRANQVSQRNNHNSLRQEFQNQQNTLSEDQKATINHKRERNEGRSSNSSNNSTHRRNNINSKDR